MATQITDNNFKEMVMDNCQLSVLDFWAEWCGPCRMISPIIDELSKEYEGKALIGKVNVDENSEIPSKYGVRNIPTILFIKNGEVVDKQVGAVPRPILEQKIKAHL